MKRILVGWAVGALVSFVLFLVAAALLEMNTPTSALVAFALGLGCSRAGIVIAERTA